MKKVIKLDQRLLCQLVEEQLNETTMAQGKVEAPLRKFIEHMNGAKSALGDLFQNVSDPKASEQAQSLLNAVTRIIKAVDSMPALSKDPWHDARRRS